jgi:hypothetical protein
VVARAVRPYLTAALLFVSALYFTVDILSEIFQRITGKISWLQ